MANYVLEILDGDRAGEVLALSSGALRIGRKSANDLVLADEKTSGVHAEVVFEGDRHVLRDLGSTNGTFLDGKRVTEVVLSVGDVVTVGRLRVKFRGAGEAASAAGDFAMHRLDAGRVQKRGGSLAVLGFLLVAAAGVGGYFWWSSQDGGESTGGPVQRQREALVVGGNKLAQAVASCEEDTAWNLQAFGLAFQPTGSSHTGRGALEAVRLEDNETDFAIAQPAQPLTVFSGRSLLIAAHVRTAGAALVGVRAVFSSSKDNSKDNTGLRFRTGTALQSRPDWQRIEVAVGVPPGCDRLALELLAVLPDLESAAYVDDVAVTEAGAEKPLEHEMKEGGQTLVGTGTALAVRSTELTMVGVGPGSVPAALAKLHAADLCVLSDVGAALEVTPDARSITLAAAGQSDLQLVFPADSAGQTLARTVADGPYDAVAAESATQALEFLLGGQVTRVLVRTAAPVEYAGKVRGGFYRMRVGAAEVELVLGFNSERSRAGELLRIARGYGTREPGRALELLHELQSEAPQDSEVLGQASNFRSQILARLDDAIAQLQREFAEAQFFDTRGGFERVARGVDDLTALYGESNMADRAVAAELRTQATERLVALDGEKRAALRHRFEDLEAAFAAADEPGLAALVKDYVQQNLGK